MDKLDEFVNEQIRRGANPSELKAHLARNGWSEADINRAIGNATGRNTRKRIALIMVGIIIVAVLAFALISTVGKTKQEANLPENPGMAAQTGSQSLQPGTPSIEGCSDREDSLAKDECYKALLKNGFRCSTLKGDVEKIYCGRANEELSLKGVEVLEEG
jgi:hypothetical protein